MAAPTVTQHASEMRRGIRQARRVVIKVGTPTVTHVDGTLALGRIGSIVEQIARMRQEGRDVVIVTSGAISTGAVRMRKSMTLATSMGDTVMRGYEPPIDAPGASAVGQALLMNMYETLFSKYNLSCAQLLTTEDDLNDLETLSQVCDATMELLSLGTVPILNDNDAVTGRTIAVIDDQTNEVRWDNDVLASRIASALRADLLVMLTDLDALYVAPEKEGSAPTRLPIYCDGADLVRSGIRSEQLLLSDNGRGSFAGRTRMAEVCMQSLVDASRAAVANGVRAAVVTTGHHPLALVQTVRGEDVGTLFVAPPPTAAAGGSGMLLSKL